MLTSHSDLSSFRGRGRLRTAVAAGALAVAGAASFAATTSRLTGVVVDAEERPLAGVTVVLSSDTLMGGRQRAVTDAAGSFAFELLPPGWFLVEAEHLRYTSQAATVRVTLDVEARVRLRLPPQSYSDEVRAVVVAPLLDPARLHTGQSFDRAFLEAAPIGSGNRSYQAVAHQAPGVGTDRLCCGCTCASPMQPGGNPRVMGSSFGENAYLIDGMDTTDPATATWLAWPPFDAIQEVNVQTAGFDAEYGNATGGVVNLVTRSGGNRLSGSLDLRYSDDRFYTEGEHYDAEDAASGDFRLGSATLGGPLLRDRLWFFAAGSSGRNQLTPSGAPSATVAEWAERLARLTWQPVPSWHVMGLYVGSPTDIDNSDAAWYVHPEATEHQRSTHTLLSASAQGIFSKDLLGHVRAGRQRGGLDYYPQSGDLAAIGRINLDTGEYSGNSIRQEYSDRDRDVLAASLSRFSAGTGGVHDLKGGVELSRRAFRGAQCSSGTVTNARCPEGAGGIHFEDLGSPSDPIPFLMVNRTTAGFIESSDRQTSAYLQDTWRPTRRLTLKLGLRWDRVRFRSGSGGGVAALEKGQPRIGAAFDLTGDGRTLLRASWGRFMHPSALFLPAFTESWYRDEVWYSCSLLGVDEESCQELAGVIGGSWRADPIGYDPSGWLLFPDDVYGSGPNAVAANLRAPYNDHLTVGIERQLFPRTAVELTWVHKRTRDIIDDTCVGNVPAPSQGADCSSYVAFNLPGLRRDYRGVILRLDARVGDWLRLLGSYAYSSSKGNIETTQLGSDYDIYPWHFANRDGYLSDHRRHRAKLNGFVALPWDVTAAFSVLWTSAYHWQPFTRDVWGMDYGEYFLEPRGSRRGGPFSQVDLQLSKGLRIGALRLELIASVFNVLDREGVLEVCESAGCGDDLGSPREWQVPRSYEAGFRLQF